VERKSSRVMVLDLTGHVLARTLDEREAIVRARLRQI
jgi:hypothetical protein